MKKNILLTMFNNENQIYERYSVKTINFIILRNFNSCLYVY